MRLTSASQCLNQGGRCLESDNLAGISTSKPERAITKMLSYWLQKFRNLRVDRACKTPAPHKPLLLLAIIDFVENGVIDNPCVYLSPELAFRFLGYWESVGARGRLVGRVELPFFYLRSDSIISHVAREGLIAAMASIRPRSVESLNRVISHAELPVELFNLMQDERNRAAMRKVLLEGDWFLPEERQKLNVILGIEETSHCASHPNCSPQEEEIQLGRDIRFRLQIVPIYGYACVLCGVKMLLPSGITLVEAAHIHQFSKSRNDDVTNGMALCRNHHWAFDQGLWTLGSDFEVIVATAAFFEDAPNQMPLRAYQSSQVDLSYLAREHRPNQKHLDWHRRHKFVGAIDSGVA